MCNRYQWMTDEDHHRPMSEAWESRWRLAPLYDMFPDKPGPVIRNRQNGRPELAMMTWGMPTPEEHLKPGAPDKGVTNVRKTFIDHWKQYLDIPNRCIVQFTKFAEWTDNPVAETGKKQERWFALDKSQPLAYFAGVWTTWDGARGAMKAPRLGTHELYGFLTTNPNGIVMPIHGKAMPVILKRSRHGFKLLGRKRRNFNGRFLTTSWCSRRYSLIANRSRQPAVYLRELYARKIKGARDDRTGDQFRRMTEQEYAQLIPPMRDQIKSMPWYYGPAYLILAGYAGTDASKMREGKASSGPASHRFT